MTKRHFEAIASMIRERLSALRAPGPFDNIERCDELAILRCDDDELHSC